MLFLDGKVPTAIKLEGAGLRPLQNVIFYLTLRNKKYTIIFPKYQNKLVKK